MIVVDSALMLAAAALISSCSALIWSLRRSR